MLMFEGSAVGVILQSMIGPGSLLCRIHGVDGSDVQGSMFNRVTTTYNITAVKNSAAPSDPSPETKSKSAPPWFIFTRSERNARGWYAVEVLAWHMVMNMTPGPWYVMMVRGAGLVRGGGYVVER